MKHPESINNLAHGVSETSNAVFVLVQWSPCHSKLNVSLTSFDILYFGIECPAKAHRGNTKLLLIRRLAKKYFRLKLPSPVLIRLWAMLS